MSAPLIVTALRLEAALISSAAPRLPVRRVGMGPDRSRAAVESLSRHDASALIVLGVCGGLVQSDRPGEVIVADQVRACDEHGQPTDPAVPCWGSGMLTDALKQRGLMARSGTIASSPRIVHGAERDRLSRWGADAVEMESAWLAAAARGRPFAVIRVFADTPNAEFKRPVRALDGWLRASLYLHRTARALQEILRERELSDLLDEQ